MMKSHECAATKICSKCKEEKSLTEFHKRLDSHAVSCKECVKEYQKDYRQKNRSLINDKAASYREDNREVLAKRSRDWYESADKVKVSERMKQYRKDNIEKVNAIQKDWDKRNRDKKRKIGRRSYRNNTGTYIKNTYIRKGMVKQATPVWYDAKGVNEIYKACRELTKATGIKYHVDHIIPINSEMVCGLHTLENLRIVTAEENLGKSNKLVDDIV